MPYANERSRDGVAAQSATLTELDNQPATGPWSMTAPRKSAAFAIAIESDQLLGRFPFPETFLTPDEIVRAERLVHERARKDFLAAHLLARLCVSHCLGVPFGDVSIRQRCSRCGGSHGRPEVVGSSDTYVSWSHSFGYAAAVVSGRPCGVDIEFHGRKIGVAVQKVASTKSEFEFLRSHEDGDSLARHLWLRKEALVKAGLGSLPEVFRLDAMGEPIAFASRSTEVLNVGGRSFNISERSVGGGDVCVAVEVPGPQIVWLGLPDLIE
ncbi:phosphopantetheinyl transferase [Arthrobacter sp. AG258]|nr:phosphopantetheinyl transferase [Arthrobacter sp. AG258]